MKILCTPALNSRNRGEEGTSVLLVSSTANKDWKLIASLYKIVKPIVRQQHILL